MISAIHYGVVTTGQSGVNALGRATATRRRHEMDSFSTGYVGALAGTVVGMAAHVVPGDSGGHALLRTAGRRLARSSTIGLLAQDAGDLGGAGGGNAVVGAPSSRGAAAVAGGCIAAVSLHRQRAARAEISARAFPSVTRGAQ